MSERIKLGLLVLLTFTVLTGCSKSIWPRGFFGLDHQIARPRINPPQNITVLLPLEGRGELALTSQAIRNGFLAAYDYSRTQRPNININVINTAGKDVRVLYQKAVTDGADVIVGPLTKKDVDSISTIKPLPVPTIALNTLDDRGRSARDNLYQFGLSPMDESEQVALKMIHEHFDRVAVIAPEGAWSNRITSVFKKRYELSGGQVVATLNYRVNSGLAKSVCNFLANDPAVLCVPKKKEIKKKIEVEEEVDDDAEEEVKFQEPMRRQDIDAIFLLATTPKQAKRIVPLLKFYYANDLPIYSISTIYSGVARPASDRDLDNVYFCDMPWVLKNPISFGPAMQAVYEQITTTWPKSFARYNKFYALGVDAYNLAVGLNVLLDSPLSGFNGATGTLYLNKYNHIYRELQWARVKNGVAFSR